MLNRERVAVGVFLVLMLAAAATLEVDFSSKNPNGMTFESVNGYTFRSVDAATAQPCVIDRLGNMSCRSFSGLDGGAIYTPQYPACSSGQFITSDGSLICADVPAAQHPLCAAGYVLTNSDAGYSCTSVVLSSGHSDEATVATNASVAEVAHFSEAPQVLGGGCLPGYYLTSYADVGFVCAAQLRPEHPLCEPGCVLTNDDGGYGCTCTVDYAAEASTASTATNASVAEVSHYSEAPTILGGGCGPGFFLTSYADAGFVCAQQLRPEHPVCPSGYVLTNNDSGYGCVAIIDYATTAGSADNATNAQVAAVAHYAEAPEILGGGCGVGQYLTSYADAGFRCATQLRAEHPVCAAGSLLFNDDAGYTCRSQVGAGWMPQHPLCAPGYALTNDDAGYRCVADVKLAGGVTASCPQGEVLTASDAGTFCTATITQANNVNGWPVSCAAGDFANGIASGGGLTCSTPAGTYSLPAISQSLGGVKGCTANCYPSGDAGVLCWDGNVAQGFYPNGEMVCTSSITNAVHGFYATATDFKSGLGCADGQVLTSTYATQALRCVDNVATSLAASCPASSAITVGDAGISCVSYAPANVGYWTKTASSYLSAEQSMGALATGLVINTNESGVPTIMEAQSCTNQFVRSYTASGTATCASVNLSSDTAATALPATKGGTGQTTTQSGGLLYGRNSNAAAWGAGGAAGNLVTWGGADTAPGQYSGATCSAGSYVTTINSDGTAVCTSTAAWTAVTFQNSWANCSASYPAARYRKGLDGRVHLSGCLVTGTSGTVAFTLPAGYRPATALSFAVDAAGGFGRVLVYSDGTVKPIRGAASDIYLEGASFYTDQ